MRSCRKFRLDLVLTQSQRDLVGSDGILVFANAHEEIGAGALEVGVLSEEWVAGEFVECRESRPRAVRETNGDGAVQCDDGRGPGVRRMS